MLSHRPYLLRAFFDWIVDNECTPHIIVNALHEGAQVPQAFVNDGQIVLNIAPRAVTSFEMDNEAIRFSARFGGVPVQLFLPTGSILGIYAQENGKGMMFEHEDDIDPPPVPSSSNSVDSNDSVPNLRSSSKSKPSLRVVK
jgi:stringent starvation protein B